MMASAELRDKPRQTVLIVFRQIMPMRAVLPPDLGVRRAPAAQEHRFHARRRRLARTGDWGEHDDLFQSQNSCCSSGLTSPRRRQLCVCSRRRMPRFSHPVYEQLRAQNQVLGDLLAFHATAVNATVGDRRGRVHRARGLGELLRRSRRPAANSAARIHPRSTTPPGSEPVRRDQRRVLESRIRPVAGRARTVDQDSTMSRSRSSA